MKLNLIYVIPLTCFAALTGWGCNPASSVPVAKSSPTPARVAVLSKTTITTSAGPNNTLRPTTPYAPTDLSHWKCSFREVERGDPKLKAVALTFDADWSAIYTVPIIKALQAHHYRATFFVTGNFCRLYPKATLALAAANMEIGSHSNTHPHFAKISDEKIRKELEDAETSFRALLGHGTKPLFRFPYGESDKRSRMAVANDGFQPIYWSLDSWDAWQQEKTADFVRKRITPRIKAGDIVLMHVSSKGSAEALPSILKALDKRGLKVVPVSAFLKQGETPILGL